MKAAAFAYRRAADVDEAVALLREHGDEAKIIAGGQSLVPMLNMRLARPGVLVDVNRIGLDSIELSDGRLRLGALVRHATLERDATVAREAPLLRRAAALIGHPAIRTRGTVGGSLAHADPAAELTAVAAALEATAEVTSHRGSRTVDAADLFDGPFMTTLEPDELVVAVTFPRHGGHGVAFEEVAIRAGDFAVVGVAATVRHAPDGVVESARVALSGVAGVPVRVPAAEEAVAGHRLDDERLRAAGAAAAAASQPPTDVHGSAAYRRHLADVLTRRALARCAEDRS